MRVALTLRSRNEKTGPIPVSTSTRDTCPPTCPMAAGGCYAQHGRVGLFWKKVDAGTTGADWQTFTTQVAALPAGTLWRHNQAGDLPGQGDTIDAIALAALVAANAGKRGFTYTHKPATTAGNARAIAAANRDGFTVNLSADTLTGADELAGLAIGPVVAVLPASVSGAVTKTLTTPAGRIVVVCPATYRDDVTCKSCGLCAVAARNTVVGFPAHGAGKARASAIATA